MSKLETRNLKKSFGEVTAVDGLSFTAHKGSIFGLVGRNGAGKTTALRMITDIYEPDSGEILFNGAARGPDFHTQVGYLPEERGLYRFMSVIHNLLFLAEIKGIRPEIARPKAMEYLKHFDLEDKATNVLDTLSKGNQQKVQFIGTILHEPDLVILDEPFAGLDPVNTTLFQNTILGLKRSGKIVILSTHQMDIAEKLCDHIALIDKGRLLLNSSVAEIKAKYSATAVSIKAEGDLTILDSLPFVSGSEHFGSSATIKVRSDDDIQAVLRTLVEHGVKITQFVANEMSMHDIFVSLTRTAGEAESMNRSSSENSVGSEVSA